MYKSQIIIINEKSNKNQKELLKMDKLQNAAKNAINICIGLKPTETIMIIHDRKTKPIAEALKEESGKITNNIFCFELEMFGKRPITYLPCQISSNIDKCDIIMFLAGSFPGELEALRRPIRMLALKKKKRLILMPKITEEVFIDGLSIDHYKLWNFSKRVHTYLKESKSITVTSKAGTNITAEFDKNIKWINSDGDFRKFSSDKLNLPGAEVFTCPKSVNGTFIIDLLMGDYFTNKYGLIKEPLITEIKNSRLTKITSKNKPLQNDFIDYIKKNENSDRVGEFAFGTNIFLKKFHMNFLIDEKFPGFHMAFGNPYPERTNADWSSKTHIDCLIKNATAIVDNEKLLIDGKYQF